VDRPDQPQGHPRNGARLDLTAKEFSLLSVLARRQGEILSKTSIAEMVWDINFDSDANVVEVAIKRLRAKLDGRSTETAAHHSRHGLCAGEPWCRVIPSPCA
jgi:two-component system copper resistance phosphate regulon response regulator CusR